MMNNTLEKLFSKYYSSNKTMTSPDYYFQSIPKELINVLTLFKIKSLFDAGCRNRDWISLIDFKLLNVDYTGGDISKDMVDYCNKHYPEYTVTHHDCTTDPIPTVDCVLISDVLIHLSNHNKLMFLKNFIRSQSKFLLMTSDPTCIFNDEISIGPDTGFPWAPVNWKLDPWRFPDPIHNIHSSEYQNLSLWTRDQLKNRVDNL